MTDNLYDGSVKHWTGKDFPLVGVLKVDGVPLPVPGNRTGGDDSRGADLAAGSLERPLQRPPNPAADWFKPGFDDSAWKEDRGAFGTKINEPTAKTDWTTENIWVRRTFPLDETLEDRTVYLVFSNDDTPNSTSTASRSTRRASPATRMPR